MTIFNRSAAVVLDLQAYVPMNNTIIQRGQLQYLYKKHELNIVQI